MTERDDLVPPEPRDARAQTGTPTSGDPSLELFGNGWSPDQDSPPDTGSYRGRHRAEDT